MECLAKGGCKKCHLDENDPGFSPLTARNNTPVAQLPQRKTEYLDPESTGRKRAAKLYPLDKEEWCDWRLKKNCGGGRRPIIGCLDGKQTHRHHGPVKKTTRNEEGNVHRICSGCHVHWHELNDLVYDEGEYNLLKHDPVEAMDTEVVQNIIDWKSGKMARNFQLASAAKGKAYEQRIAREGQESDSLDDESEGESESLIS